MSEHTHIPQRTKGKQRIYAAAATLFRDKGYTATSMRDLASAVGLEPSSLYSHIKSKQEVLRDICFECGQRFLDGIDGILLSDEPVDQKIYDMILLHVVMAQDDITAMTVFNDEWRHLAEPDLSLFRKMRKEYEDKCMAVLSSGIESGKFRSVDLHVTLNAILSSTHWIQRSRRMMTMDAGDLASEISTLFLKGLLTDGLQ